MGRKNRRPGAWCLQGDAAFLSEAVRLPPGDVALLAGLGDCEDLPGDVRALLAEAQAQGRRQTVALTVRVSRRLAEHFHGDGDVLYTLGDPWALLNILRVAVRRVARERARARQ